MFTNHIYPSSSKIFLQALEIKCCAVFSYMFQKTEITLPSCCSLIRNQRYENYKLISNFLN